MFLSLQHCSKWMDPSTGAQFRRYIQLCFGNYCCGGQLWSIGRWHMNQRTRIFLRETQDEQPSGTEWKHDFHSQESITKMWLTEIFYFEGGIESRAVPISFCVRENSIAVENQSLGQLLLSLNTRCRSSFQKVGTPADRCSGRRCWGEFRHPCRNDESTWPFDVQRYFHC